MYLPSKIKIISVRTLFLIVCGFTLPVGEGVSQFLQFDISKVFPVIAGLFILFTAFSQKIPDKYFPPFFNYFIVFIILHTIVVYGIIFPEALFERQGNDKETGSFALIRFFLFIGFSYALAMSIKNVDDFKKLAIPYSIGFALTFFVGLKMSFFSGDIDADNLRVKGGAGDPNMYATTAIIVFFFNLLLLAQKTEKINKWFSIFCMLMSIAAVILSQSRTAFVSCFVTVLYVIAQLPGVIKRTKIIFSVFILLVLVIIFLPQSVKEGIKKKADIEGRIAANEESRLVIWKDYAKQFHRYSLQGLGRGRAEMAIKDSHTQWKTRWPHNHYWDMLIEFGITGFVLFMVSLGQMWSRIVIKKTSEQKWQLKKYVMPAFMVSMLTTIFFIDYITLRDWWLFCAIIISFAKWKALL